MRTVVLGNDDQPAGCFIEPMDDAWTQIAASRRKRLESMQQGIDERSAAARVFRLARSRVHHHACRFVDYG